MTGTLTRAPLPRISPPPSTCSAAAAFLADLPALRRSRLADIYARHRPDKHGDARAVAAGYEGRCGALAARLHAAYGAGLDEFDRFVPGTAMYPSAATTATAAAAATAAAESRARVSEPEPAAGPTAGGRRRLSRCASPGQH